MARARQPDEVGFVERDGVHVHWERCGTGERTILFLPTWEIVPSRCWKFQVAGLARHFRVLTFDPRGHGLSDRPQEIQAYDRRQFVDDAIAVLDVNDVERALFVSWCSPAGIMLAAEHPDRVTGIVEIATDLPLTKDPWIAQGYPFDEALDSDHGWAKFNRHYWLRDWRGFVEFFFAQTFTEPHSTKQLDDAVGWALETDAATVLRGMDADWPEDPGQACELCARVQCRALVLQGSEDAVVGRDRGRAVAAAIPASHLVTFQGSGHAPHMRDPVMVNHLVRAFAGGLSA
jgi:pimeloyl-ACP methyl ester carboxylesterase